MGELTHFPTASTRETLVYCWRQMRPDLRAFVASSVAMVAGTLATAVAAPLIFAALLARIASLGTHSGPQRGFGPLVIAARAERKGKLGVGFCVATIKRECVPCQQFFRQDRILERAQRKRLGAAVERIDDDSVGSRQSPHRQAQNGQHNCRKCRAPNPNCHGPLPATTSRRVGKFFAGQLIPESFADFSTAPDNCQSRPDFACEEPNP